MSWKAKPSATTDPVSLDVLADLEKPAGGSFVTDALRSRWTAEIIPKYATRHGALMPILHDLQDAYRCIPYQAMIDVALFLEITPAEVLDTTSFYEEYHTEPVGRCVVGVCQSIACEVCGHQAIVDHIRNRLDLEPHETDDEGRFTLLLLECLGSCDTAPVALFAVGIDLDFGVFKKNIMAILGATIFKLILMPILAWYMCQWLGLGPAATVAVVLCSSVAAAKCEFGVAKQKNIYVEQTAAIVASTTILSFITLAFVVIELNDRYPEVFDMDKHFHFAGHSDGDPKIPAAPKRP